MDLWRQDEHFELRQSLGQFDVGRLRLENEVENMDGGVEIQLLGGSPENQTPRCHGLGVPEMVNWMLRLLLRLMLKLIFRRPINTTGGVIIKNILVIFCKIWYVFSSLLVYNNLQIKK